jgi:hypothetical protein
MLCSVGLAFIGGMSGAGDDFYTFVGLCLIITGIWGGILLIKA